MRTKGIPVICVLSIVAVAQAERPKSVAEVKKALARQAPVRNTRGHGTQPAATTEASATAAAGDGAGFSKLKDLQGERKQGWPITDVVFSADGKILAAANHFKVRLWQVDSGKRLGDFLGKNDEQIMAVRFLPGGKHLVSASNRTVRVWDWAKGAEIRNLSGCHTVELSRDGKRLLAATENGCGLWRTDDWKLVRAFKLPPHRALALSPDGRMIAIGERMLPKPYPPNYRAAVTVLAAETGKELARFPGFAHRVVFSPEGKRLAVVHGGVALWSLAGKKRLRTFKAGRLGCGSAAFSPNGRLIAAGGGYDPATETSRGALAVWDVATGRLLATLAVREGKKGCEWVAGVAFSADGRYLAACDFQGAVRIWQVRAAAPKPHAKAPDILLLDAKGELRKARPATEPLDLDKTAKMLTKAAGGTWRTKTKALHGTIPMNGVFDTLCVVFPFPYDEAGKAKVLSFTAPRARGFRVLGSTEQCTVLVDRNLPDPPEKAAAFFAAVSKALKLRPATEPLDLDKTAKMLTKAAGGTWRTRTTNDVGVTLNGTMPWGGRFHTLCVVFPFRYDEAGKAKVLSYADCARPFRVLGSTEQCIVLTDQYEPHPPAKAAAFAAAVSKALKLRPPKLTLEALRRSRQLKANINSFNLQVWYHGPKPKRRPYYRLLLTAVPIERKERPYELIRVLEPKQAEKIIDHLAVEGFLTHAVKMDKETEKAYKGPAVFMTIPMGTSRLEGTLGWGPGLLNRLDALRKVLDGDAAKAMDGLLKVLAAQNPEWGNHTLPVGPRPLGKILSVRQVVRGGYTFIAICEALNEPQAVADATGAYQKFKVHAVLGYGTPPAGKTFNLNYHYQAYASPPERPVRKGEKVIWIVSKRADPYKGVRALAYTPENHNAVDEAVLFERYAGKAVNGLKLTLRAAKATTAMRPDGRSAEPVPLTFTFANVGDKPIRLETSDHLWPRLKLHVTGPNGKSVRITERMAERIGHVKVTYSVLKAGQSVTYSRRSGEYFGGKHESHDLLKPGAYRIWASYLSAVAVSNEITLTVKAAPAAPDLGRAGEQMVRPLREKRDIGALIGLLRHEDKHVRASAAEALGRMGPAAKGAVAALRQASRDANQGVREAATKAMKEIGTSYTPEHRQFSWGKGKIEIGMTKPQVLEQIELSWQRPKDDPFAGMSIPGIDRIRKAKAEGNEWLLSFGPHTGHAPGGGHIRLFFVNGKLKRIEMIPTVAG